MAQENFQTQTNNQKDSTAVVRKDASQAATWRRPRVSASGQLPGKSNYFIRQ